MCWDTEKGRGDNFKSLPRASSAKSGAVFERMVSPDNIASLLSDKNKEGEANLSSVFEKLILLYADANETEAYYHQEIAELFIFQINLTDTIFGRVKAMASADLDRPETEQLLNRVKEGYEAEIIVMLETQVDQIDFNESDFLKLSKAISGSLTEQISSLDEDAKVRIKAKIEVVIKSMKHVAVKDVYMQVLTQL